MPTPPRIAVLALLLAACDGTAAIPGPDGGRPAPDAPDAVDAPDASDASDGGYPPLPPPPPVEPGDPPLVHGLLFPPAPQGVVPLLVVLVGTDPTADVTLDVSCAGESGWRPATVLDPLTGLPVSPEGAESIVRWDSLADLDFHAPRTCALRAIATGPGKLVGSPKIAELPAIDNLREAARRVDHPMFHYGRLTDAVLGIARTYQLVVLDPRNADLTRAKAQAIQAGVDPNDPSDDVILLCYVSIGEDRRTTSLTDDQLATDPRFAGDGSGPRVDPRGPGASGGSLAGLDPLGLPSAAGTGYASYYLDDNDVLRNGAGDGRPDRNAHFGGAFVNAGDPKWFDTIRAMTIDGADRVAGLDEILTTTRGRGLGCDGLFLDTFDTAAPNSFTNLSSSNLSQFEWTAPGVQAFLARLRATYPGKVLLQNRGLFFFHPRFPHFAFNGAALIDFALFESFRLDSSTAHEYDPYGYPNNRYNYAPVLLAEAGRGRGFRVLSLGYAEGPPDRMSELTLTGESTLGFDSLVEDVHVAQTLTGFRHYLTDAGLSRANTFARDHSELDDRTPPVWTSTYNDNSGGWPDPPGAPTPRVGLRELSGGPGLLTLRWDVALDLDRVRYAAYVQAVVPFDFAADPGLAHAARFVLAPRLGRDYARGNGPGRYPYEADLTGLMPGVEYHVVVRAFDDSPDRNEERNQVVLSATPR